MSRQYLCKALLFLLLPACLPAAVNAPVKAAVVAEDAGLAINLILTGGPPYPSRAAFNEPGAGDAIEIQLSPAGAASSGSPALLRLVRDLQGIQRIEGSLPLPFRCGRLRALRMPFVWNAAGVSASVSSGSGYSVTVRFPAALLGWLLPEGYRTMAVEVRSIPGHPDAAERLEVSVPSRSAGLSPLLVAAAAYIEQGPREAAGILEGEARDPMYLPVLAVMRELAGDRDGSLRALGALAAQPLLPAAAREWAQFERARILAGADPAAVVQVAQQLLDSTLPSNAARAQGLLAQLTGQDVMTRLLAVLEPGCGKLPSSGADAAAYARCATASTAVTSEQKIAVIQRLQQMLVGDGEFLAAFRAGTAALGSPALRPFSRALVPPTVHALNRLRPKDEQAAALSSELIQAVSTEAESFVTTLQELEARRLGQQAQKALTALLSSPEAAPRLRSLGLLAQLRTLASGRNAVLAAEAGRRLVEASERDAAIRRLAARFLSGLQATLPPAEWNAAALQPIQEALGGSEPGCSSY